MPLSNGRLATPRFLMRLRLVHTLSLTLLAFTGVAVLALGGLTAWHLRNGFGEYLAARDVQHFERFVGILEARLSSEVGVSELMLGRMDLRSVLEELNPRPEGPPDSPGLPGKALPPQEDAAPAAAPPAEDKPRQKARAAAPVPEPARPRPATLHELDATTAHGGQRGVAAKR